MLHSVDDLEQRARQIVLRLLEKGPRTSAQLLEALASKEIPAEIASAVVLRFAEVELVDDQRFAEDMAAASRKTKGLARSMVRRKLATKGLNQEIIDQVASEITDEDELAVATELASKRLSQLDKLDKEVIKRRLVGFLQRRGFSSSIVFAAIREAQDQAVKSEL
jgi:regulatory protein